MPKALLNKEGCIKDELVHSPGYKTRIYVKVKYIIIDRTGRHQREGYEMREQDNNITDSRGRCHAPARIVVWDGFLLGPDGPRRLRLPGSLGVLLAARHGCVEGVEQNM